MGHVPRQSLLLPVLLGVFFLAIYLLSGSSDLKHNGDTDLRYQTAQALVDHHRLWIAHPMWTDTRIARGRGGHLYAFYAPGQTLLMVPLYIGGRFLAHHLSLPYDITTLYTSRSLDLFLGACLAVLFFLLARSVGYAPRICVALTLIFGLATPAWPDAQSALEQTPVDLFLLIAVYAAWQFVRSQLQERRWLLLAGTGVGLAVFTRYDALLFVPVVALYPTLLRWKLRRPGVMRDWLVYATGVTPWIALVALWNVARFGSPFQTGLHEQTFGEAPWFGLAGLLVSPGKGLLWYLPLVFLLPWAARDFYRRVPSLAVFFGVLILLPLAFYATVLYWHGDPAWGPRYLYTALPYLVLPLGEILSSFPRRSLLVRGGTLALIAVSWGLQCEAVSVTQWRFWYRLEAAEQRTSQPFHWGARYYHYYWNVSQSPILVQLDDVYQVVRLNLGDQKYRLSAHPGPPNVSNPAVTYPVNTLAFWWADTMHPLLSSRTRMILGLGLGGVASLAFLLLVSQIPSAPGGRSRGVRELGWRRGESSPS
jgi:hypothetical protein